MDRFLLLYYVLYVKRSLIPRVCNPLIDDVAALSFAICIIDINWPTSLIALRILQSLVLLLDAALLLRMPTTASLAAASQTWLAFVCLAAFCLTYRPAYRLAFCCAIPFANRIA
jgi:hypothetical protein